MPSKWFLRLCDKLCFYRKHSPALRSTTLQLTNTGPRAVATQGHGEGKRAQTFLLLVGLRRSSLLPCNWVSKACELQSCMDKRSRGHWFLLRRKQEARCSKDSKIEGKNKANRKLEPKKVHISQWNWDQTIKRHSTWQMWKSWFDSYQSRFFS